MRRRRLGLPVGLFLAACCAACLVWLRAQSAQFTAVRLLTNAEVVLTLTAPTGINHRLEGAANLAVWNALVTFPTNTTTSLSFTDSAAAFLGGRFYRALELTGSTHFSGDHLQTTNGDVIIHPLYHASLALNWNGVIIYADPDDDPAYEATYRGMPKANLILVTHSHLDHLSTAKIESLRTAGTVIIGPQAVFNGLTTAQRTNAIVLGHGGSTNILGLHVEAVYAYNSNHSPVGFANGYVLTLGGKRIYISGDTGDAAQIRALTGIDVAFVCMNIPYTMTASQATNAVLGFRPAIVYPYHYRDQSGATTNAARFKQLLGTGPGIEVRLRKWY